MNFMLFFHKLGLLITILTIIISAGGCGYFEVYNKTNYVSKITSIIKKQQDEVDNYMSLLNGIPDKKLSDEELKKEFQKSKDNIIERKRELENITAPKAYANEHANFIKGFQLCIEAIDASIAVLDTKDEKVKYEKAVETKNKMVESRRLIDMAIKRISVDLR